MKAFTEQSGLNKYWIYKREEGWRVNKPLNHPSGGGVDIVQKFEEATTLVGELIAIDKLNGWL